MEILFDKIKTKLRRLLYTFILSRYGFGNRVPKSIWEEQFGREDWHYLYSDAEKGHYLAIVNLLKKMPSRKVLDVGCGQGVLYHYLKAAAEPLHYLGIDLSDHAIKKATATFPEANFKQLDFDCQQLKGKFDVIIFNESLYYFNRPLSTIRKCISENLNNGGYFIISMCDYIGHEVIWQKLEQRYNFLSIEEIINLNQQKWKVGLFKT